MNTILYILKQHKEELFKKYLLRSMALYGSCSRGEENKDSDVKVRVEMSKSDARAFINLSYELETIVKCKIELVSKNGMKERYMKSIANDLLYV